MSVLDDPFLAEAISDLVDRRVEAALAKVTEEIGVVRSVDAVEQTAVVQIKGVDTPQIALMDRVPIEGDRVLVRKSQVTGLRFVWGIFGRNISETGGGGGAATIAADDLVWEGAGTADVQAVYEVP